MNGKERISEYPVSFQQRHRIHELKRAAWEKWCRANPAQYKALREQRRRQRNRRVSWKF